MKTFFFLLAFLAFVPLEAQGQNQTTPIEAIEDECLREVMQAGTVDFSNMTTSDLVNMCQGMPLSEDLFVQMLSIVVGPAMVPILDAATAITGTTHNLTPEDHLFKIAQPLHATMKAFNYVMLAIFGVLVSINIFSQLMKWQKLGSKEEMKRWVADKSPSTIVVGVFLAPVIGWLSPLQFLALLAITCLGVVTKFAVVYLFLGAFFSDAATQIKQEMYSDLAWSIGKTVLVHQCDIESREDLLMQVQRVEGTSSPEVLSSNSLYNCLTSSSPTQSRLRLRSSSERVNEYVLEPGNLVQTQSCVSSNRELLDEWGASAPPTCGHIILRLPNNSAINSVDNAIALYANAELIETQRELALKVHEYECRQASNIQADTGGVVPKCLQASIAGDGYEYNFLPDRITGDLRLTSFRSALGPESGRDLRDDIVRNVESMQRAISSNTSAMLQHIRDVSAPRVSEAVRSAFEEQAHEDFLNSVLSNGESGLGFSETDGRFLVNNIKRGAWTSGSLFFGKFSKEIQTDILIDKLASVYDARVETHWSSPLIYSLFGLNRILTDETLGDTAMSAVQNALIPRVGLYLDSIDCWYSRMECSPAPLNPFTYLGERGATLIEGGFIRFGVSKGIGAMAQKFMGPDAGKLMLTETLSEFYLLYIVLGIILAILIPGIPLIKLLIMLVNWVYDVLRELLALQITLAISPAGAESKKIFNDDVREALARIMGLGLYFVFIIIGVCAMFIMFSFLFGLNVFFVGILSYVVQWTGAANSIEAMVMNTIFDIIITGVLVYEVKLCSTYIQKFPQEMAEFFKVKVSDSANVMDWFESKVRSAVLPKVGDFLTKLKG